MNFNDAKIWLSQLKPDTGIFSRFFKYVFLVVLLFLTLRIVFDGYSYYLARRSLDTELEAKKIASLEYLKLLAKRENALMLVSLETRCIERSQLALFRTIDSNLAKHLRDSYEELFDAKERLQTEIRTKGIGLIRVDEAMARISVPEFSVTTFDLQPVLTSVLRPIAGVAVDDPKYQAFLASVNKLRDDYVSRGQSHYSARENLGLKSSQFLDMTAIKTLEERLKRVKEERKKNREKYGDLEELIAKYEVWTSALSERRSDVFVLDELAYTMGDEDSKILGSVNCNAFKAFYQKVEGRLLSNEPTQGKPWSELSILGKLNAGRIYYNNTLLSYFDMPPVAQTLLVTLFLGAMGALTLNVLRLSKVGWWSEQRDPLWGEIIVCAVLGALAAFGIFLIGSAGLLLTSDMRAGQNGVAPLSASFIGLLGFLSGLLYDQAFGRVRRLGSQIFASDDGGRIVAPEDLALASVLKTAGATLAAQLVITFGLGSRLAAESEFTFLVPSDAALEKLSLLDWRSISEPAVRVAFERWFRHYHAEKRVMANDVVGGPAGGTMSSLQVEDGATYPLAVNNRDFVINGVKVTRSDIVWGKGVLHILEGVL